MKQIRFGVLILLALASCTVDKSAATGDTAGTSQSASKVADTAATVSPQMNPPAEDGSPSGAPLPKPVRAPSARSLQVSASGIGPVKAGMTLEEANALLGNSLAIPAKLQECDYVRPKSSPKHVAFMVEKGQISRVEIQEGSDIATVAGAKIGDSEARIKSLYPGLATKPAKYTNGHSLVVTPDDGSSNRIVFETDGKRVTKYRSGRLPAVEYVEGCG